jgi:two-component system sensor histidine kinase and response regulator WspE
MAGIGGDFCDSSMMELFRAELDTHLPVLGEGLLALEKDPNQPRLLEELMRSAHSIKGAARIVGVDPAVRIAHVMEDCLVAAQKGAISLQADAIESLLRGFDFLSRLAQSSTQDAAYAEQEVVGLVSAITAARAGHSTGVLPEKTPLAIVPQSAAAILEAGDLDKEGSRTLLRELLDRREKNAHHYQLDLSAVRVVDPAGLAMLALFARLPCHDGSLPQIEIVRAAPEVRQLFHLTRLDSLISIQPVQGG